MSEPTETHIEWETFAGRDDPAQRFRLYRLCVCAACSGARLIDGEKCPECRGEGRTRELVATAASAEAVGVALVTLAREDEWVDAEGEPCGFGLLDTQGEVGHKWLIRPWAASPRNVSDAGRVLATARKKGGARA